MRRPLPGLKVVRALQIPEMSISAGGGGGQFPTFDAESKFP